MVDKQLAARDIRSKAVLDAMKNVPRHLFVPENLASHSYDDSPLPIGLGQTISQPYIVAYMTEQLELECGMKVLEIGTGSGYQAAILAYLGCEVFTVEYLEEHAAKAAEILSRLNYNSVRVKCGNGFSGWQEESPFDAVIVTAAPVRIPLKLIEQLKIGGRMIIPIGEVNTTQILKLITKNENNITAKDLLWVRFVPMVE